MLTQKYFSKDHLFSLDYPRIWEMEMYDEIPAFFDPMSGNGALQILSIDLFDLNGNDKKKDELFTAYPYLTGHTLVDKMIIFLHMQGIKADTESLHVFSRDGINFIPKEYVVQGRFYMSVMMEKENQILLAIYNSAKQPDEVEAGIIGEIIKSIHMRSRVN
ncbi:MAG: hypothetical protein OEV78_01845 [Spirochaetia bacterium]|nr:hypothetical protein [Spirochaetia bacterium]